MVGKDDSKSVTCVEIKHLFSNYLGEALMSVAIDMLATVRNSEATGNSANRTDAIVSANGNVRGPVATKEYADANWAALRAQLRAEFAGVRAQLRAEFAGVRAQLRAEGAGVRAHLRAEFADVRADLRAEFAGMRTDIVKLRNDLCKAIWIQGAVLTIIILACEFL